jgi:uncharacterized protein YqfB (UPF0267 family)
MQYENDYLLTQSVEQIKASANNKVLKTCAYLDENLKFCENKFEGLLNPFTLHAFCEKHSKQDSITGHAVQSARREILMIKPEDLLFMACYQREKERLMQTARKEAIEKMAENEQP